MNIDGDLDVRTNRFANKRPYREIGHVMVVHDIEMDQIGARCFYGAYFLPQPCEIGRKYGRSYADCRLIHFMPFQTKHRRASAAMRRYPPSVAPPLAHADAWADQAHPNAARPARLLRTAASP